LRVFDNPIQKRCGGREEKCLVEQEVSQSFVMQIVFSNHIIAVDLPHADRVVPAAHLRAVFVVVDGLVGQSGH